MGHQLCQKQQGIIDATQYAAGMVVSLKRMETARWPTPYTAEVAWTEDRHYSVAISALLWPPGLLFAL